MSPTVTLKHKPKERLCYTLDHASYCTDGCHCNVVERQMGKRFRKMHEPAVLALGPGEVRKGVPRAVLATRMIAAAVTAGRILVVEE